MARVKPTDYKGVRQLSVPAQDVFEFDPELIGQPSPRAPTPLDRTKRAARGHPVATADAEHTRALAEEDGLSAEVSDRLGRAATAQASRGAPQYNVSVTRLRATYHAAAAKAGLDPRDDRAVVYYLQERIDECSKESGLTGASLGIAQRQLSASMMDLKHENPAESAVVKRFVHTYQQGRRPLDTEIAGPACPIPVSDAEEIMHTVEWLRDSAMEQGRLLKALKYNMFVVLFAADLSAGARTADVTRMSSKKTWIRDGTTLCTFGGRKVLNQKTGGVPQSTLRFPRNDQLPAFDVSTKLRHFFAMLDDMGLDRTNSECLLPHASMDATHVISLHKTNRFDTTEANAILREACAANNLNTTYTLHGTRSSKALAISSHLLGNKAAARALVGEELGLSSEQNQDLYMRGDLAADVTRPSSVTLPTVEFQQGWDDLKRRKIVPHIQN
jgi:hypothetical protein